MQCGIAQLLKVQAFLQVVADVAVLDGDVVKQRWCRALGNKHTLRITRDGGLIDQQTTDPISCTGAYTYCSSQVGGPDDIGLDDVYTRIEYAGQVDTIDAVIHQGHAIDGRIHHTIEQYGCLVVGHIHVLQCDIGCGHRKACATAWCTC